MKILAITACFSGAVLFLGPALPCMFHGLGSNWLLGESKVKPAVVSWHVAALADLLKRRSTWSRKRLDKSSVVNTPLILKHPLGSEIHLKFFCTKSISHHRNPDSISLWIPRNNWLQAFDLVRTDVVRL